MGWGYDGLGVGLEWVRWVCRSPKLDNESSTGFRGFGLVEGGLRVVGFWL